MAANFEIRHILCPVDFSDNSKRAVECAGVLASRYKADVLVLHVDPVVLSEMGQLPPGPVPAVRQQLFEKLSQFAEPARQPGVAVRVVLEEGGPVGQILAQAKELPADLIVLGTHGRGGFERWVLGSVVDKVLRKARCPVLSVGAGSGPVSPFESVVCPLDLVEPNSRALQMALSLTADPGRLTLLHVVEGAVGSEIVSGAPFNIPEFRQYLASEARDRLQKAVPPEVRNRLRVEDIVATGRPYQEILRVADERKADLIVMGAHGPNPMELFFFGSTAQHVVRGATCPVLTISSRK